LWRKQISGTQKEWGTHGVVRIAGAFETSPLVFVGENVKTILSRRGGNERFSGPARGLFRRWQNGLRNSRTAASYRTLEEIVKIARTAKIAKKLETGELFDGSTSLLKNACIRSSFVL
jgi:hypothetical protein